MSDLSVQDKGSWYWAGGGAWDESTSPIFLSISSSTSSFCRTLISPKLVTSLKARSKLSNNVMINQESSVSYLLIQSSQNQPNCYIQLFICCSLFSPKRPIFIHTTGCVNSSPQPTWSYNKAQSRELECTVGWLSTKTALIERQRSIDSLQNETANVATFMVQQTIIGSTF